MHCVSTYMTGPRACSWAGPWARTAGRLADRHGLLGVTGLTLLTPWDSHEPTFLSLSAWCSLTPALWDTTARPMELSCGCWPGGGWAGKRLWREGWLSPGCDLWLLSLSPSAAVSIWHVLLHLFSPGKLWTGWWIPVCMRREGSQACGCGGGSVPAPPLPHVLPGRQDPLSSKTSPQNQAQLCRAPLQTKDLPSVGTVPAARL